MSKTARQNLFETLRSNRHTYVDKTSLIYRLVTEENLCRICRPEGFGKTLLLETIATLFRKRSEYFAGLAAEHIWNEPQRDVVLLNFGDIDCGSDADFEKSFYAMLAADFEHLGFHIDWENDLAPYWQFSKWLSSRTTNSLVLLIDDFDAPLLSSLNQYKLHREIQSVVANFYRLVLSNEGKFRFVMLAGTYNLIGEDQIFESFDRFVNLTYDRRYCGLLGFTLQEGKENFIADQSSEQHSKNCYGSGFCFDFLNHIRVYRPNSFAVGIERSYRQKVNLIVDFLKSQNINIKDLPKKLQMISLGELEEVQSIGAHNPLVLLTQAGVLTIKNVNEYHAVNLVFSGC